jgi:hypothetical protein
LIACRATFPVVHWTTRNLRSPAVDIIVPLPL